METDCKSNLKKSYVSTEVTYEFYIEMKDQFLKFWEFVKSFVSLEVTYQFYSEIHKQFFYILFLRICKIVCILKSNVPILLLNERVKSLIFFQNL